MSYSRTASHASPDSHGWYNATESALKSTIDGLFAKATAFHWSNGQRLIALISPHAGIGYSGLTAAHAYSALRDYLYSPSGKTVLRIFLIGPAHHKHIDGVELSGAKQYETPFGPVAVDLKAVADVQKSLSEAGVPVATTSQNTDEDEHSIEMQMPFVSHVLHFPPDSTVAAKDRIKIVPIIVGTANREMEERIGAVLSMHMSDAHSLCVLSSDFCHWGSRFGYMFHYEKAKYRDIGDAIIAMDHEGMKWLEKRNMDGWYDYLGRTKNTICGRRPISIGMAFLKKNASVRFVHYSQSNRCANPQDSSVSYAAAVITT